MDSFFDVEFAICALQVLIGALGSTTSDVQVTTTQTTILVEQADHSLWQSDKDKRAFLVLLCFMILPTSNFVCVGGIEI